MKKLALFLIAALLINVLAGCQGAFGAMDSSAQTPPPVENNQTPPPAAESTVPATGASITDLITAEEAKNIALKHADVKESDIHDLSVELDKDSRTLHYDVDFEVGGKDYDYEIDAATGKILKSEKERD